MYLDHIAVGATWSNKYTMLRAPYSTYADRQSVVFGCFLGRYVITSDFSDFCASSYREFTLSPPSTSILELPDFGQIYPKYPRTWGARHNRFVNIDQWTFIFTSEEASLELMRLHGLSMSSSLAFDFKLKTFQPAAFAAHFAIIMTITASCKGGKEEEGTNTLETLK